jgi:RNA polymerase sigma factor (sigma-70 family)
MLSRFMSIRLVIVDDHAPFRAGLRNTLADIEDFDVIAECADGESAVGRVGELLPEVVLMDIQMPGVNGVDATRRIVNNTPHIGVIMLTMFDNDESVFAAMRAGARGYLLKGARKDEIAHAVRAAAHGEAVFGPALARRMQSYFAESARIVQQAPPDALPELTEREREVLDLLARGKSTADIAQSISVSEKTVRNHLSNIFEKLQVTDRVQAVLRAKRAGLG